ncbi:EAL domain, c-di-GMP-specific phosphodiesterase class I (or its enzymatically inactive variant) [Limimonas halophila]|uniref:EAL domain, c-di-GMP-specific phosphodiesterase class I (Or its enzymatically inactive variant) n=1 Tax=Limimonas halophila TaxID=1082479 RepID=A0A1G7RP07_9PROT|nr:EAL domain-containing protein [Limimonas halophila]SDG11939.1 EAL domain, c-di-GMP-specific phosphodiesterase class I (or its enzymatically inactive variant) [Limimonas halophila]
MAEQAAPDRSEAHAFMDFVAGTRKGNRPGVKLISVAMHPFDATLDSRAVREALGRKLADYARKQELRFFDVNNRMFALIPENQRNEQALINTVYKVRLMVVNTVRTYATSLDVDPSELTEVIHTRRDANKLARLVRSAVDTPKELQTPIGPAGPLTNRHVEELAKRIKAAGAKRFTREFGRSQAIAYMPRSNDRPDPVGWEAFISMGHLRSQLLPGVTFDSDPEAYRQLTLRLDEVVLASLAAERANSWDAEVGHVSVNMNVASMVSDAFERLATYLADQVDAELWVELTIPDILENLDSFREAQRMLEKYNVRTMADRVTPETLAQAEAAKLDLHGYKFVWDRRDKGLDSIRDAVKTVTAQDRPVVLCRVEEARGVKAAQTLDVRHFQGFYVDDLLAFGSMDEMEDAAG